MIRVRCSAGDIAAIKFVVDPAWNILSSMSLFVQPSSRSLHAPLATALRDQNAPGVATLRSLTTNPTAPSLLVVPGYAYDVDNSPAAVTERLRSLVTAIPDQDVHGVAERLREQGSPYGDEDVAGLRRVAQDALVDYFTGVLQPFWDRAHAIALRDLNMRAEQIVKDGIGGVLNDLNDQISFDGQVLELQHEFDIDIAAPPGGLVFTPVVFKASGFIVHGPDENDEPDMPVAIGYPAWGAATLWLQEPEQSATSSLEQLMGSTRSRILSKATVPVSTTDLAAQLDLPKPTVSGHLKVLERAGLLSQFRRGRFVYYQLSPAGLALRGN
ncbi:ArsR/SmtB family transcription factor [Flexivirga alba]|uniref:ArsR/SmtB family transcription factor n=1 Tax=Flexivirga alba TaxID=702742 RepID=A0ABW2AD27_9MICO